MPNSPKPPSRRLMPLVVGVVAAVLFTGAAAIYLTDARSPATQSTSIGGPFTLTNAQGKSVTNADFRGRYMLVYFGYTFCPDVCPTTLNDVGQALDKLGPKADRIQPLFITVDPTRDTPAIMSQYTAAFTPRLEGLTGTQAQIATVAKEYRVFYAQHRTGPDPDDYLMDHSSILYVMGPDGGFLGVIRADAGPDAIARDLSKFMA